MAGRRDGGRLRWWRSRPLCARVVVSVILGSLAGCVLSAERRAGPDPVARAASVASIPSTIVSIAPDPVPTTTTPLPPATTPPPAVTTGCADALAYLGAHQAPGFVDVCAPGSALGHYGFTCVNVPGRCPDGARLIHVACPAPFVYMNEAHNSWALLGQRSGIDPYGEGTPAEQAYCNRLR